MKYLLLELPLQCLSTVVFREVRELINEAFGHVFSLIWFQRPSMVMRS